MDLSRESSAASDLVDRTLRESVGPELERVARRVWPRDTGRSADAWRFDGRALTNPEPYAPYVQHSGGPALDTVLGPALRAVADREFSTS